MDARRLLAWVMQHKAAVAKLVIALFALSIVLFLPLRSEVLLRVGWDASSLSGSATLVDRFTLAAVVGNSATLGSLNVSCADLVKYAATVTFVVEVNNSGSIYWSAWGGPEGTGYIHLCGVTKRIKVPGTSRITISYLDIVEANPSGVSNASATVYFESAPASQSYSIEAVVDGGAVLKKPLLTAFTDPIKGVLAGLVGAIAAAVRRARSVLNSALGSFWGFFGVSAVVGNTLLALGLVAIAVYLVHYRHILRRRR